MAYRTSRVIGLMVSMLLLAGAGLTADAQAKIRFELKSPQGEDIPISIINQKRESNSLVVYTHDFGATTRTDANGVELLAIPAPGQKNSYKVQQIMDGQTCKLDSKQHCGNMTIPANGIVLSASGTAQATLLKNFQPGQVFELKPEDAYVVSYDISATDPTPETNPKGDGFPGIRGGNQLIIYDSKYGSPTTGTNEFGDEVTVENGRVVDQQGANSNIPQAEGGFVISGHGKAREWLLQNVPLGSKIEINGSQVTCTVDKETYVYQLDQLANQIAKLRNGTLPPDVQQKVDAAKQEIAALPEEDAITKALNTIKDLKVDLWKSYPAVPIGDMRAIWQRPSEATVAQIDQDLDLLKQAGLNTIFLETYLHGEPIFPSHTFEAYHIPQKLPFQVAGSPDILKTWLDEAHARGMKVHVWFQTFYAGNIQYDKSKGGLINTYPEWANIQRSALNLPTMHPSTLEPGGYFLDPANQDAQKFLLCLIQEIVSRYPVDGFQLDYIRYPASFPPDRYSYVATTWGYTSVARTLFKNRYGMDPVDITPTDNPEVWEQWNQFKTRQVDRFVQKAYELVKMERPDIPVSVAIFPDPETSLVRKHQNWVEWAKNGWTDFLAPMTLTSSIGTIEEDTRNVKKLSAKPVVTGIFGPFNGNSPSEVVDQVWTAFNSGANGTALFDTAHFNQQMAKALHMGLFKAAQNP